MNLRFVKFLIIIFHNQALSRLEFQIFINFHIYFSQSSIITMQWAHFVTAYILNFILYKTRINKEEDEQLYKEDIKVHRIVSYTKFQIILTALCFLNPWANWYFQLVLNVMHGIWILIWRRGDFWVLSNLGPLLAKCNLYRGDSKGLFSFKIKFS